MTITLEAAGLAFVTPLVGLPLTREQVMALPVCSHVIVKSGDHPQRAVVTGHREGDRFSTGLEVMHIIHRGVEDIWQAQASSLNDFANCSEVKGVLAPLPVHGLPAELQEQHDEMMRAKLPPSPISEPVPHPQILQRDVQ